ncbi:MAG: Lrp/AsnC ligand binding domain-containing protein [Nitrososphaerota archaeon]|nr:Lrp/AsnC ligand binding domain-containing protein [Nitrososphaerota archaeon]
MARVFAFVNIFVDSGSTSSVIEELQRLPGLEELYEVAGEFDIVTIFSARDLGEFRDILVNKITTIKGVRSTVTDIVLHSHRPRLA